MRVQVTCAHGTISPVFHANNRTVIGTVASGGQAQRDHVYSDKSEPQEISTWEPRRMAASQRQ